MRQTEKKRKRPEPLTIVSLTTSLITALISNVFITTNTFSIADNLQITVESTCSLSRTSGTGNYSATVLNGTTNSNIGTSTFSITCNDSEGWRLMALGWNNSSSSTYLSNNIDDSIRIATGTAAAPSADSSWAMKIIPGSDVTLGSDFVSDIFHNIPSSSTRIAYGQNSTSSATITSTYQVHISPSQTAGTYNGGVKYTVTHPAVLPDITSISTMQEMTPEICAATTTPNASSTVVPTNQLRDTRDSKYYWVAKLADGNCWMTQNLDLDLTTAGLSSNDSDIGYTNGSYPSTTQYWDSNSTYAPAQTQTTATVSNSSNTGTSSWSLGDYAYDGATNSNCGITAETYADCTNYGFSITSSPTVSANHYHVGNLYQWNAATAGSGGTIQNGQAQNSICPKGWRLPTSNTGNEFQTLLNIYGITNDTATSGNVQASLNSPLYFTRNGTTHSGALRRAGTVGSFWSNTSMLNNSLYAYYFYFNDASSISPSGTAQRLAGLSVRCIAR